MRLGANHPMGPLQLADFIGLDTCLSVMQVLHDGLADTKYRPCPLLVKYVEAGWLGRKSKRGFYDYRRERDSPSPGYRTGRKQVMRGLDDRTGALFSYVDLETRVRGDHPLRAIRTIVNEALVALEREFPALTPGPGGPRFHPRSCCEPCSCRPSTPSAPSASSWSGSNSTSSSAGSSGLGSTTRPGILDLLEEPRPLLDGDVAAKVLTAVLAQPQVKRLLSTDHFSVDGTLIEAWASMKSFAQGRRR